MWFIVSLGCLLAGAFIGLTAFASALTVMALELLKTAKEQMLASARQASKAEAELTAHKEAQARVVQAIEANSLPWIPKNDNLDARYEREALDKLETPTYAGSYQDMVDGLGR